MTVAGVLARLSVVMSDLNVVAISEYQLRSQSWQLVPSTRRAQSRMSLKRVPFFLASILLISHNADASQFENPSSLRRCLGSVDDLARKDLRLDLSPPHRTSSLTRASLVFGPAVDSRSTALVQSCPVMSTRRPSGDFREDTRVCSSLLEMQTFVTTQPVVSANVQARCRQDGRMQTAAACAHGLVEDWWDKARKVTLEF
jgi:hypothetical protein